MGDGERSLDYLKAPCADLRRDHRRREAEISREHGLTRSCRNRSTSLIAKPSAALSDLDAKGRRRAIAKELGAVFLIGIGGTVASANRTMCGRRIMMTGPRRRRMDWRA